VFFLSGSLKNPDDVENGGELTFGGINTDRFNGSLSYVNLKRSTLWRIPIHSVLVGGQRVEVCQTGLCEGVIDAGTSDILGSKSIVKPIFDAMNVSYDKIEGAVIVPGCNSTGLPDITFVAGGVDLVITPNDYIRKIGSQCFITLNYDEFHQNSYVLGTPFMGRYYSVFDIAGERMGFAVSNQ